MIGRSLAHYAVVELLGKGGMGEVYRATDTSLGRDVALKVLPTSLTNDPERVARFEREARVLASLQHPNVAAVYGFHQVDGVQFLAMELVEGEDLSQRLRRGAMSVPDAIEVARQIALGLEAAHAKGIVHRDLKPANVKMGADGWVKILDFGLARAYTDEIEGDPALSPTITAAMTQAGVVLGTAAYMSPEQARGRAIDARTDVWAFGCVLFEMLTGQQAYEGETISDVIARILEREPALDTLPAATPPRVRRVLRRCLQKDPRARVHAIADARIELEEAEEASPANAATATLPPRRRGREIVAWSLAGLALVSAVGAFLRGPTVVEPSAQDPIRFTLEPEGLLHGTSKRLSLAPDLRGALAISPDGRELAFVATGADGEPSICVRSFDQTQARLLEGTNGVRGVFWSPDAERIGFLGEADVRVVDLSSGYVQRVATGLPETRMGGSWSANGSILVGSVEGIFRVDLEGNVEHVASAGGFALWPTFLPDGRHFLYLGEIERGKGRGASNLGVHVATVDDPASARLVLRTPTRVAYEDGHLFHVQNGALLAQRFDLDTFTLTGPPTIVGTGLEYFRSHGGSNFSVAGDRVVFASYRPPSQHHWIDREGRDLDPIGDPDLYSRVTLISPDGTRAVTAVGSAESGTTDLLLIDLERGTSSRVTRSEAWENNPVWSPDGQRIAYASDANGPPDIYVLELAKGGEPSLAWAGDGVQEPMGWTPDGRAIVFANSADARRIWSVDLESGESGPLPPPVPMGGDGLVAFSPDGAWMAFASTESGRSEIYVQPYGRSGQRVRLSPAGGSRPRWSQDGRALYYQNERSVVTVPTTTGERFTSGEPKTLFTLDLPFTLQDLGSDGRFLVLLEPADDMARPIQVLVGWRALVRGGQGARPGA